MSQATIYRRQFIRWIKRSSRGSAVIVVLFLLAIGTSIVSTVSLNESSSAANAAHDSTVACADAHNPSANIHCEIDSLHLSGQQDRCDLLYIATPPSLSPAKQARAAAVAAKNHCDIDTGQVQSPTATPTVHPTARPTAAPTEVGAAPFTPTLSSLLSAPAPASSSSTSSPPVAPSTAKKPSASSPPPSSAASPTASASDLPSPEQTYLTMTPTATVTTSPSPSCFLLTPLGCVELP